MTTIHVRYEILGRSSQPPSRVRAGCLRVGVRAVGLAGNLSVYGVGDTLDEALLDLGEGIRTALADGPIPEELTREIAVVFGDAA